MSQLTHTLASLWRYPVKSMMGEELNAAELTSAGLWGDRAYALVDAETNQVISAKNPRKWPDFFAYHARYTRTHDSRSGLAPVWIQLPDGRTVCSDEADAEAILSAALKAKVTLSRVAPSNPTLEQYWPEREGADEAITQEAIAGAAPEGSFFDYATVHILTTATLAALQALYPQSRFETRRFRPNLVIATDARQTGFVENDWVGKTLHLGDEVVLHVTDPCPRCVMPTLAQADLPRDPDIMRAILHNKVHVPFLNTALPSVGIYARVIQAGTVTRGASVRVE
ncbi:MAG: MOSC domain-containing protein [Methylococcaceae bacterium]